jgi:hypothetical protein
MTDEQRLARLTELARRVWPEASVEFSCRMWCVDAPNNAHDAVVEMLAVHDHPRALDALETCLLVLADEERVPLTADQVTRDALENCRRGREALLRRLQGTPVRSDGPDGDPVVRRLRNQFREARAAMEVLASEWEAQADEHAQEPQIYPHSHLLRSCARELRARLKP